jgi:arginase
MMKFVCIGVPYFLGQRLGEQRTEVTDLRASGFAEEIGAKWIELTPDTLSSPDPITAVNRTLANNIEPDTFPLIFASDCVSSIGAVKGLMTDQGLGVIWFDAHGDFNTPETSPSGFLGGMPLAMLVGRGDQNLLDGVSLKPLHEADIILTDGRDLDPEEAIALKKSDVRHLPDVRDLLSAPLPQKPLYIHFDTDVVNLSEMPAMSYPSVGGPTLADTIAAVQRIIRDGQVAGILFSLWNGALATNKQPLESTLALARAVVTAVQAK